MVSVASLWLPILLSAVVVFVASSLVHMVLPFHRSDFRRLPDEDGAMDALRPFAIPPGDYMVPCPRGSQDMKSAEFREKHARGPVAVMTVFPNGEWGMGRNLALWFVYCVVVSVFAAYNASRAAGAGADYLTVFRFAGCMAFAGYALALWQNSIWYRRAWRTTLTSTLDGLLYALLTAGVFGWLWH